MPISGANHPSGTSLGLYIGFSSPESLSSPSDAAACGASSAIRSASSSSYDRASFFSMFTLVFCTWRVQRRRSIRNRSDIKV